MREGGRDRQKERKKEKDGDGNLERKRWGREIILFD